MPKPTLEATKDAGRNTIFTAIATIATFITNFLLDLVPQVIQMRPHWDEVRIAIIGLVLLGTTAGLTYLDSYIHHDKTNESTGLMPF